jgi:chitinase
VGTVTYYLVQGVPRNKIVVGVPFYGNQYVRNDAGLYGAFDNTGLDPNSLDWDVKPQPSYHDLVDVAGIVNANGYTRQWNAFAGEPYLTNPNAQFGRPATIVYSDPQSIGERTQLIKLLGLRGAMAWELSQDSNDHALIGALSPVLN